MWAVAGKRALTTTAQPQRRARTNDKSVHAMMSATTKIARAARAMVTTKRMPGNKEGKGGTGHGVGNESDVQQRGRWQQRQEQWQRGWRVSNGNEGNGNGGGAGANVGDGDGNEAGGQQRGQGQGWQGHWRRQ